MKARIVRIGNSQGVRIPKLLLEEAGIAGDVEITADDGRITIVRSRDARDGWASAAQALHGRGEDKLLETPPSGFDEDEWEWR